MSVSVNGTSSVRPTRGGLASIANGTCRTLHAGVGARGDVAAAAGDAGGLELDEVAAVEPGVGAPDAAVVDRRRHTGVEDGLGVRRLLDAQADAQPGVGVDLRRQAVLEVLRDEQQVEPEGAADAGDRLELLRAARARPRWRAARRTRRPRRRAAAAAGGRAAPPAPPGTTRRCWRRRARAAPGAASARPATATTVRSNWSRSRLVATSMTCGSARTAS